MERSRQLKLSIYLDDDAPVIGNAVKLPRRKLIAFGYCGGKFSNLSWLLPLLPECFHYVEPFGGSAAVLLNRQPSPIETYNDIDGEVVNFFRVLREQKDRLIELIALTPYSREEFYYSLDYQRADLSELERARRFYVRVEQTYSTLVHQASLGRWGYSKSISVSGMAQRVSSWLGKVSKLAAVAARLLTVQIENRPALDLIRIYDSPRTLFYCDPPYPFSARRGDRIYRYEMSDDDHRELADLLHRVKGKVAISGYRCDLTDNLYKDWRRYDAPPRRIAAAHRKSIRYEALWTNY